jgi:glycosyltransferase involved in cell wall biosynthesis
VVYTGNLRLRKKGLNVLLAVARQAPEIQFVLVGSKGNGPVERVACTIENIRIVPRQRFRDLTLWLYAADVLIIPPSLEPLKLGSAVLSMKLFLYLAAGRVILAPRAPDTAELLRDEENAVLVPAGDVGTTVATLRAIATDPARAARLGAGALNTAQHLTWDARAKRISEFVATRLDAPPPRPEHDPWRPAAWLAETMRWIAQDLRIP